MGRSHFVQWLNASTSFVRYSVVYEEIAFHENLQT